MRAASETAWRELVTTSPHWFTEVTPIRQIASPPIASRPVSRTSTIEELDAAGDPMGVLLGAGSREPSRVVRTRRRARAVGAARAASHACDGCAGGRSSPC